MGLALITGASRGIGFELAKQFAGHGYHVVVAAEDGDIETAADQLSGFGTEVRRAQIDVGFLPDSLKAVASPVVSIPVGRR